MIQDGLQAAQQVPKMPVGRVCKNAVLTTCYPMSNFFGCYSQSLLEPRRTRSARGSCEHVSGRVRGIRTWEGEGTDEEGGEDVSMK
eukprot:6082385-Pyramimonas_sp.AAC.1